MVRYIYRGAQEVYSRLGEKGGDSEKAMKLLTLFEEAFPERTHDLLA